jgi:hypothetical protein
VITERTTLTELEAIAREHHVQSILLERPPNGRSGVACRVERADRVVVVKTGATVAEAIAAALGELASRPWAGLERMPK